MPDYQSAKIYKLWSPEGPEVYIGSTTQKLCKRKAEHKGSKKYSSKILFEKYEQVIIELIEKFPCNNREDLNKREGMHIRMTDCINKRIEGRTRKEYSEDNVDIIKKKSKKYYQENAEHIKEQQKKYHENNPDKRKEITKKYREDNPEYCKEKNKKYYSQNKYKILEHMSQKMTCECGMTFSIGHKTRHEKTLIHKKLLNSLPE